MGTPTIAKDDTNTFAYCPVLIALLKLARAAATTARGAKLSTTALEQAIASAEAVLKQPADEKSSALAVPEATTEVLHLFDLEKW